MDTLPPLSLVPLPLSQESFLSTNSVFSVIDLLTFLAFDPIDLCAQNSVQLHGSFHTLRNSWSILLSSTCFEIFEEGSTSETVGCTWTCIGALFQKILEEC